MLKIAGISLATLVLIVILYFVVAFILARIPVNGEAETGDDVEVFLLSNGVHTDIVVPVTNQWMDWTTVISRKDTEAADTSLKYVGFGWGDKGFYLQTPTWSQLKVSVAFKALFGLSSSAIHATFYDRLHESDRCKRIRMSKENYIKLVRFIGRKFQTVVDKKGIYISTDANYGKHDAFYEAKGVYSIFYTCNTWTNDALKLTGQKAALWTPFEKGIFYHYR
ncbi:MAG: TIGR02117 family protein [Bacteroidota bacterium]